MSTRAIFIFIDDMGTYQVYKHYDGYPRGAYKALNETFTYAFLLPRFEANEFAAAFIAANRSHNLSPYREFRGGELRLMNVDDNYDSQYRYYITLLNDELHIEAYGESAIALFNGTLDEMKTWAEEKK